MASKEKVECPKCGGKGKLTGFYHVENGDCFMCGASGKVLASKIKTRPLTDYQKTRINFIKNCRPETIERMSYKELLESMKFSCWSFSQEPKLKGVWESRFRVAFNAAQEEMLKSIS